MTRGYAFFVALCLFVFATGPARAQAPKPAIVCENGLWSPLSAAQIAAHELEARIAHFSAAATGAKLGNTYELKIIPLDCPISGYAIRSIKTSPGIPAIPFNILPTYNVYVTVAYLRNKLELEDLARDARKQVCLIRSGIVDAVQRGDDPKESPLLRRCMLEEAVVAGDTQYASWLARGSGVQVPTGRTRANENGSVLQHIIEQLKDFPDGLPPGSIKALESLRDSLPKQ